MFGCKHEWEEIERQVVPSRAGQLKKLRTSGEEMPEEMKDILYGYTLFFYRCTKCRIHKSDKITGAMSNGQ